MTGDCSVDSVIGDACDGGGEAIAISGASLILRCADPSNLSGFGFLVLSNLAHAETHGCVPSWFIIWTGSTTLTRLAQPAAPADVPFGDPGRSESVPWGSMDPRLPTWLPWRHGVCARCGFLRQRDRFVSSASALSWFSGGSAAHVAGSSSGDAISDEDRIAGGREEHVSLP